MKKLNEVLELVKDYSLKYRNETLKEFKISEIYDLFPGSDCTTSKWPEQWPNNGSYGVYLIMDENYEVIYIGKSNSIGRRLSSYFQYSEDRSSCKIVHPGWTKQPKYVCTIAVPSETWFEHSSLEEFLIWSVDPCDNTRSKPV